MLRGEANPSPTEKPRSLCRKRGFFVPEIYNL